MSLLLLKLIQHEFRLLAEVAHGSGSAQRGAFCSSQELHRSIAGLSANKEKKQYVQLTRTYILARLHL